MKNTNIRFRKHDNGLYLGKFSEPEDAYNYIKKLKDKYLYASKWKYSIRELCREAEKDGVIVYPHVLSNWFQNEWNVTIKSVAGNKPKLKKRSGITVDKEVDKILYQLVSNGYIDYNMRSWYINKMLRFFLGLPNEEVLVLFEDELDLFGCLFFNRRGEVRALYIGNPQIGTKKLIESLCSDGQEYGMQTIIRKTRALGYYALGADDE